MKPEIAQWLEKEHIPIHLRQWILDSSLDFEDFFEYNHYLPSEAEGAKSTWKAVLKYRKRKQVAMNPAYEAFLKGWDRK
jgi:hypothetical protein